MLKMPPIILFCNTKKKLPIILANSPIILTTLLIQRTVTITAALLSDI